MTANHVGDLMGSGSGFGLGFQIRRDLGAAGQPGSVGDYGWGGAYHTTYWVDPAERHGGRLLHPAAQPPAGRRPRETCGPWCTERYRADTRTGSGRTDPYPWNQGRLGNHARPRTWRYSHPNSGRLVSRSWATDEALQPMRLHALILIDRHTSAGKGPFHATLADQARRARRTDRCARQAPRGVRRRVHQVHPVILHLGATPPRASSISGWPSFWSTTAAASRAISNSSRSSSPPGRTTSTTRCRCGPNSPRSSGPASR